VGSLGPDGWIGGSSYLPVTGSVGVLIHGGPASWSDCAAVLAAARGASRVTSPPPFWTPRKTLFVTYSMTKSVLGALPEGPTRTYERRLGAESSGASSFPRST
jgi:hypothetical protein